MLALIIDTETNGLDPTKDAVLEVGCILYSLPHATPMSSYASLMRAEENGSEAVNRIPAMALQMARPPEEVWEDVRNLARGAHVVLAHNAAFDRAFVPSAVTGSLPWVCTQDDIQWPRQTKANSSIVRLALEHDLGVAYAHRAFADCDLIARLLTRSRELGADLVEMVQHGMRPKGTFQALVSYDDREKAKAAGFRWDPETRRWLRTMAVDDAAALPFPTKKVA
jgi:DNA polymerase-3 subunit epsilon